MSEQVAKQLLLREYYQDGYGARLLQGRACAVEDGLPCLALKSAESGMSDQEFQQQEQKYVQQMQDKPGTVSPEDMEKQSAVATPANCDLLAGNYSVPEGTAQFAAVRADRSGYEP